MNVSAVRVDKFSVSIYVGLQVRDSGIIHSITEVENICQTYCNRRGFCVTVTPTKYVYSNGWESGAIVGLINYPRFPENQESLTNAAMELATELMIGLDQKRVTIDFPTHTTMLTHPNL